MSRNANPDPDRDPDRDRLRARLARIDPAAAPGDPMTSRPAPELLERAMSATPSATPAAPASDAPGPGLTSRARRRPARAAALAAAAAAAVALGGAALLSGGDEAGPGAAPTTLALRLPDPLAMASCVAFDEALLADMSVAFAGTVTGVAGDTVTLDVTRWYKGGSADVVTLDTPGEHSSASLDAVAFEQGRDYLVTATAEGTVNGCGFSGAATPGLTASFERAFAG